jgi:polar amino acid transport system substrate-binding protein
MKIARLLAAIVAFALLARPAAAADQSLWEQSTLNAIIKRGELRIGLEAGYAPFEMRDKRGAIIGFDVDLAKLMAHAMGVKPTFVNTQWDGIIPALLTDKFDILMSGMTITSERNLQVNFVGPYVTIGQTVLLNKKDADKVHSYKDLDSAEYTVVTKLGTSGDNAAHMFMPKAKLKQFETEADAVTEVRSGRADAFVYDLPYNQVYMLQFPGALALLGEPFTKEPLGWAVRKGDPDFLNWLDNFLLQIKSDGTFDALYVKWFQSNAWLQNLAGP